MRSTTRARVERFRAEALLVRSVAVGESDSIVTLLTDARGMVSAVARGARRASKRFAALEPMHLLAVSVDERAGAELGTLAEASIAVPRMGVVATLERLEAAGQALRWVRDAMPSHTPEPEVFRDVNGLLDDLDRGEGNPRAKLAAFGLRLLAAVGWGLELERCVHCGKACAPEATAAADAALGGLVCRACGSAPVLLRGARRARMLAAVAGEGELDEDDARVVSDLVDRALAAHAGRPLQRK